MSEFQVAESIVLTSHVQGAPSVHFKGKPSMTFRDFKSLLGYLDLEVEFSRKRVNSTKMLATLDVELLGGVGQDEARTMILKRAPNAIVVFKPTKQTTSVKNPSGSGK